MQVEAMGVKEGISLAIDKSLQKIVLEIDSRELFLVLTNKYSLIDWKIRSLVRDI